MLYNCSALSPCSRPAPSRTKLYPIVRSSTPSSVAIHWMPCLCASASTSSETLPSDGHSPIGRDPKVFSCDAMARWICWFASSGPRIRRYALRQDLSLFRQHRQLIVAAEIFALPDQPRNFWIAQKILVEPCQLRQHLQVGVIPGHEVRFRPFRPDARRPIALQQLPISRVSSDHVDRVGLEQVLQREAPFSAGEFDGWLCHQIEEGVVRLTGGVIVDLVNQRWHQVEVLVDIGKLFHQLHHAVVVL